MITRLNVELSKPTRGDMESELGTSGNISPIYKNDSYDRKPNIADLERMIHTDGTARALYKILTLPILANTYRFDADPDDELKTGRGSTATVSHPQKDLVQDNFELPPHKGGMTTPLRMILARMLKANVTGYQVFEKVWQLSLEGQVIYKKLAPRPADGVTLLKDDNGGYNGFKQFVMKPGGSATDVTVDVDKSFLFTMNKEEDWVEGESNFRTAYYHFDKKHRLYVLYEQQAEKGAVPLKILGVTEGNTDDDNKKAANLHAIEDFGVNSTVLLPKGYTLDGFDVGKGRLDPMPGVDHHNAEMARSVLAQFILLGTDTGNTGSYALSKDHSDLLIMSLQAVMQEIEEHINFYVIPQLHDYNFPVARYCEFRFNDMTDQTKEIISDTFGKLIQYLPNALPTDFVEGLVQQMADRLEIDIEDLSPGNLGTPATPAATPAADGSGDGSGSTTNNSKGSKKKELSASQWRRPLTEAEQRVDFTGIQAKLDTLESDFASEVQPVFNKITAQAIDDLKPLLQSGDVSDLSGFKLKFSNEYRNAIKGSMTDAYNFGKKGAAEELDTKIPATPSESKDFVYQIADSITTKQLSDLAFIISSTVTGAVHKGQLDKTDLSVDDVVQQLQDAFDAFFSAKILLTGGIVVSEAVNRARDDVFSANKQRIVAYQYSAILDRKTCPLCEELDGTSVEYADYKSTKLMPPLHQLCRCIWVAILKTDPNVPDITGFGDGLDALIAKYQTLSKHVHGGVEHIHIANMEGLAVL